MNTIVRSIATTVAVALIGASMPLPASAGTVGTESVVREELARIDRDALRGMLDRADVRAELQKLGVDPVQAQERIAAMTDDEVAQVQGRLAELPAGGDSVLGVLFLVFVILLVTDILGLTKVFPFTRSVR